MMDLSLLPAPDIIDAKDYETILSELKADIILRDPSLAAAIAVESDPLLKLAESFAYRELGLRKHINDSARAVMLAHATGADLDNLAAFFDVTRLLIDAGNNQAVPPVPPTYESDTDLRNRVLLALYARSTAGPSGAYIYRALSADGDVKDAKATRPADGQVQVTVLSRTGDGTAPQALLDAVTLVLSDKDVRPLTDQVSVASAVITAFDVTAQITVYPGPDSAVVLAESQASLATYLDSHHKLGHDITLSGLYAALTVTGVQKVTMTAPVADIVIDDLHAAYATTQTVTVAGTAT